MAVDPPSGPAPVGPDEFADLNSCPVPRPARECFGEDAWELFEMSLRPHFGHVVIERLVLMHYSQMSLDLHVGCGQICCAYIWATITMDMERSVQLLDSIFQVADADGDIGQPPSTAPWVDIVAALFGPHRRGGLWA